ncbi:MAG: hypothetical protein GY909_00205 [Oligoflexia bacterium]|nr:hypothetical protein [Oligoflexia bacterium]
MKTRKGQSYDLILTDIAGNSTAQQLIVNLKEPAGPDNSINLLASVDKTTAELGESFKVSFEGTTASSEILKYLVEIDGIEIESASNEVVFTPTTIGIKDLVLKVVTANGSKSINSTIKVEKVVELAMDPVDVIAQMPPKTESQLEVESFVERNEFLFFGSNPIQKDTSLEDFEKFSSSMVRGVVRDTEGNQLSGVKISLLDKEQYGFTTTTANGEFSYMIPAGVSQTLVYEKPGYLSVQRNINVEVNNYSYQDNVILLPISKKVTKVDFGEETTIAFGEKVNDERGEREIFTVFPEGTTATMIMEDGTEKVIDSASVRFTEYTVGREGVDRMPGSLPETSEYTFAFEASIDEAIVEGAKTVEFNKPLFTYVTNFLNLPAGSLVPSGYYNREEGRWIAEPDGMVVKILSKENGKVSVSLTPDDTAVSDEVLAKLDFTDEELANLHDRYEVGDSFWRMPIMHFTPFDFNFPYFAINDGSSPVITPDPLTSLLNLPIKNPNLQCGSIIDVENQTLAEEISIDGTNVSLRYESRYASLNEERIVQYFTTSQQNNLQSVSFKVGGQKIEATLEPVENTSLIKASAYWNGLSSFGTPLFGRHVVEVDARVLRRTTYSICVPENIVQRLNDINCEAFRPDSGRSCVLNIGTRQFGRSAPVTSQECNSLPDFQTYGIAADVVESDRSLSFTESPLKPTFIKGLNGWSLTNVHRIQYGQFFPGDGKQRNGRSYIPRNKEELGFSLDLDKYTYSENGDLYFQDNDGGLSVRRSNGSISKLKTFPYSNDFPQKIVIGADGKLYGYKSLSVSEISILGDTLLIERKLGNSYLCGEFLHGLVENNISSFDWENDEHNCGGGLTSTFSVDKDGKIIIYLVGSSVEAIVSIDREKKAKLKLIVDEFLGRSSRVVAGDWANFSVGTTTIGEDVTRIKDIIDSDTEGNIYIVLQNRTTNGAFSLYQIKGDNEVIQHFTARDNNILFVDKPGVLTSSQMQLNNAIQLNVGRDELLLSMSNGLFLYDLKNKQVEVISDLNNTTPLIEDTNLKLTGTARSAQPMAFGSRDQFILLSNAGRVLEVEGGTGTPVISASEKIKSFYPVGLKLTVVPDEELNELYVFNDAGYHIGTHFLDTQNVKLKMEYDSDEINKLVAIKDSFNNALLVDRISPSEIELSTNFGFKTNIVLNDKSRPVIVSMKDDSYLLEYNERGLLSKYSDPIGKISEFFYDENDLVKDVNNFGNEVSIASFLNEDENIVYTSTSSLGRVNQYIHEEILDGNSKRTVIFPDGSSSSTNYVDGILIESVSSSGDKTTTRYNTSPITGNVTTYPSNFVLVKNNGETLTQSRSIASIDSNDPEIKNYEETISDNGDVWIIFKDIENLTETITSPEGRVVKEFYNEAKQLVKLERGNYEQIISYNTNGLTESISDGFNSVTYTYNEKGLPSIINSNGEIISNLYDDRGRLTYRVDENGRGAEFTYDGNGNLSTIKSINGKEHTFINNILGFVKQYLSPVIGSENNVTEYQYSTDNELLGVTYPSGRTNTFVYDETTGQLKTTTTSSEVLTTSFIASGQLGSITSSLGESLTWGYNGSEITSVDSVGTINGSLGLKYDVKGLLQEIKINNGVVNTFGYDRDRVLNSVSIGNGYNASLVTDSNNFLTNVNHGDYTESYTHDDLGRVLSYSVSNSGGSIHEQSYEYLNGRVSKKTVDGVVHAYEYDKSGQLVKDNTIVFDWDLNGNNANGSFDDQDRIESLNGYTFTHDLDGNITKVENTSLGYTLDLEVDERAILRKATVNGKVIDYVIDPLGRRVGKKVNGTLTEGYLYLDQLNPIAKLDGSGTVTQTYIYADKGYVPAFMEAAGKTYRFITDNLGSVVAVMDTTDGSLVQEITYDAFGNILSDSNPNFQPFAFAGGLYDQDTKLTRFGARDYNPVTGRWMQKDPIGFNGGDTNLYRYANNDPVNNIDPNGLQFVCSDGFGCLPEGGGFQGGGINNDTVPGVTDGYPDGGLPGGGYTPILPKPTPIPTPKPTPPPKPPRSLIPYPNINPNPGDNTGPSIGPSCQK